MTSVRFAGQRFPLPGGPSSGRQDAGGELRLPASQAPRGGDEEELVGAHGHLHGQDHLVLHSRHLCHKVSYGVIFRKPWDEDAVKKIC